MDHAGADNFDLAFEWSYLIGSLNARTINALRKLGSAEAGNQWTHGFAAFLFGGRILVVAGRLRISTITGPSLSVI